MRLKPSKLSVLRNAHLKVSFLNIFSFDIIFTKVIRNADTIRWMLLVLNILRFSVNLLHCSTKRDLSILTGHFFSHNEQSKLSDVQKRALTLCGNYNRQWMKFKQTALFSITTRDKHQHPQVAQQQRLHHFSWFSFFALWWQVTNWFFP